MQNQVYNPFNENSKKMIHDMENVSTSNYARPLQKYCALIVCRIGQEALCTARVEIACATRIQREN